jgi:3-oxoacyl-[acyl-carrier-protein] synthase-3
MPHQIIKNEYFSKNVFYTKDGTQNPKPGIEVIKKLKEISGIKERRFIGEEE